MFDKHESQPSGLVIPTHARISGKLSWRVRDEAGNPEVARNESGFVVAPAEGVEQHNLLTDLGLDDIGRSSILNANFRNYFHIGEGSSAPQFTDATLDAEVQRGTTTGQQLATSSFYHDADGERFVAEISVSKALTMGANRNLAEFGFSGANTANVRIRELLRDSLGEPVAISLLSGKVIDVLHTLRLEIAAPLVPTQGQFTLNKYDAANQLISSTPYNFVYGPNAANASTSSVERVFVAWDPAFPSASNHYVAQFSAPGTYTPIGGRPSLHQVAPGSMTARPYEAVTYERIYDYSLPTNRSVGDIYGLFRVGLSEGFVAYFTDPPSFAKSNAETLDGTFISTWERL